MYFYKLMIIHSIICEGHICTFDKMQNQTTLYHYHIIMYIKTKILYYLWKKVNIVV